MKRIISLLVITALALALASCKKEKKEVTVALEGYVNFINGDVSLIGADGKGAKAKIGDAVKQGMKIKTVGPKSVVDVYFGENAIKVLGNTVVEVKKLLQNAETNTENSELFVEKGRVFSKVAKKLAKGDIYEVKSPTTTAGVRGTDFLVTEEDGKGNIACLDGKIEVVNNTKTDTPPVVLNPKEEVDVLAGKDMVKKQLSEDKLRMLQILLEIKNIREDIRKQFEKQREEIRKYVVDQKEKDKTLLEQQKEGDKALVEDQKKRDREMIDGIKNNILDESKEKKDEAVKAAKGKMDDAKNVDMDGAKKTAEDQKDAMKPKIEKKLIDKDQFKVK